jgi:peroxin-19
MDEISVEASACTLLTYALDLLDDFSAVKVDAQKPAPAAPKAAPDAKPDTASKGASAGDQKASVEEDFSEEDFARQLQAGMADLLGELDKSVSSIGP